MFLLASNSKFLTVSALHHALEQANIKAGFAGTVKSILPEFELVDKEAEVNCTFIDILTHRTALPEHNMFLLRLLAPGETIVSLAFLPLSHCTEAHPHFSLTG
jgi:CubicO group peptidase (beta-lactamase class C family)